MDAHSFAQGPFYSTRPKFTSLEQNGEYDDILTPSDVLAAYRDFVRWVEKVAEEVDQDGDQPDDAAAVEAKAKQCFNALKLYPEGEKFLKELATYIKKSTDLDALNSKSKCGPSTSESKACISEAVYKVISCEVVEKKKVEIASAIKSFFRKHMGATSFSKAASVSDSVTIQGPLRNAFTKIIDESGCAKNGEQSESDSEPAALPEAPMAVLNDLVEKLLNVGSAGPVLYSAMLQFGREYQYGPEGGFSGQAPRMTDPGLRDLVKNRVAKEMAICMAEMRAQGATEISESGGMRGGEGTASEPA